MKTPQEIEHEQALADTRGRVDIGIEQFRWIYELALAALKSAMLINGGAAIALELLSNLVYADEIKRQPGLIVQSLLR